MQGLFIYIDLKLLRDSNDPGEIMEVVRTKEELAEARKNKQEKITVEGSLGQGLLKWTKIRKITGFLLLIAALFAVPVKDFFTEPSGYYPGLGEHFRFPLASGRPGPTGVEITILLIVVAVGILLLTDVLSRYDAVRLSAKPPKLVLIRKTRKD